MELLPQLLDEGRRVLLFSQFTSMLALIEKELDSHPSVTRCSPGEPRTVPRRLRAFSPVRSRYS